MHKEMVYVLFLLLLSGAVLAGGSFSVDYTSVKSSAYRGEEAIYELKITNYDTGVDNNYLVLFPENNFIGRTEPLGDYNFQLPSGESKTIRVSLTPRDYLLVGPYMVKVVFNNINYGVIKEVYLPIQVLSDNTREYLPTIRMNAEIPDEIDPREQFEVVVTMDNLNYRNLTNLSLLIESDKFSSRDFISIGPMGTAQKTYMFKLDDLESPYQDSVSVKVWTTVGDRYYQWDDKEDFRVKSYSDYSSESYTNKFFLGKDERVVFYNRGNSPEPFSHEHKFSMFSWLFIDTEPEPNILRTEEGRFFVWSVDVDSQDYYEISVKYSYMPLLVIILAFIVLVIFYYLLRSPVVVKKEVSHIGTSEGGISDIKVILHIRNRGRSIVDDLSITEKIPHIANIGNEFQVGTIRPVKVVQNPKKGSLVKWELSNLEAYEERIITYHIKSKLSILGGLTLPATVVRFARNGRYRSTKSNRLVLEI